MIEGAYLRFDFLKVMKFASIFFVEAFDEFEIKNFAL